LDSTYSIYSGVDHLTSAGEAVPGRFAEENRYWRMGLQERSQAGGHCTEPVAWVGCWKLLDSWTTAHAASAARPSEGACIKPYVDHAAVNGEDPTRPVHPTPTITARRHRRSSLRPRRRESTTADWPNRRSCSDLFDMPSLLK
jgi:hypothetical protein